MATSKPLRSPSRICNRRRLVGNVVARGQLASFTRPGMMVTIRIYRIAIYTRQKLPRPGAAARECAKDTNYLRRTRFNGIVNHLLPPPLPPSLEKQKISFISLSLSLFFAARGANLLSRHDGNNVGRMHASLFIPFGWPVDRRDTLIVLNACVHSEANGAVNPSRPRLFYLQPGGLAVNSEWRQVLADDKSMRTVFSRC